MIDDILNLYYKKYTDGELKELEAKVMKSNNPRYIFIYAYYFQDKIDKNLIENKLIELNNLRYLRFYFRSVKSINTDLLFDKILSFNNPKEVYYAIFDDTNIDDKYIILAINKLIGLNENRYLLLLFYYYFNVLKGNNLEIINLFNKVIGKSINNILEYLETLKDKYLGTEDISSYNEFTENCYKGHGGYIPDMIVCHISNNYEHAIDNFYNKDLEVSSHFIIARDGRVKQVVDLHDSSWCNGTSLNETSDVYYKFAKNDIVRSRAYNANYYTFSIEHESFDGSLTDVQYEASLNVIKKIIKFMKDEYNVDFKLDRDHLVGHRELNPIVRTICPGNKFPFDKLLNDLKNI